MSIALREEITALKRRFDELEKTVTMLRESLADVQGKQIIARETLKLPEKRKSA